MYIAQVYKYKHDFWRYIIGVVAVVAGVIAGQIPLTVAIFMEKGMDTINMTEADMMTALESNLFLFLMLLTFVGGLIALLFIVKYLHGQQFRALTTARKKIDWSRVSFGFLLVGIFIIIVTVGDYFANQEDYISNFNLVPFLILCVIAIVLIPLQTSFEEYFFRGYLMQGIGILSGNRWLPLIITSLVFGGLHYANPEVDKLGDLIMVHYIGTGFFLGIIALMDDGLELALGFHAGNNLLTALLVTADWTAFQTHSVLKDISEPSLGWDVFIPVLVIYPIYLVIMARKYKWSNWKERLFGKIEKPSNDFEESSFNQV